jgi:hypothetical protein
VDEQGLRQPRHADEQAVATREEGQEREVDDLLLADDELAQLGDDRITARLQSVGERNVVRGLECDGFVGGRDSHAVFPLW